ncbi:MAG: fumarate hydratase C-terminal domain-containing protein [Treponemataceae bacterium]|nr:fumarate hydratase C-terminal domain-containing protein [Treponemataceae bacterium]
MKPFSDQYDAIPLAHPPLERVAADAFGRLSFRFPRAHLEHLIAAALSPDASDNDRFVCACMLKNALIAREGRFPLCQDTGIATVFGWKKGTVACAESAAAALEAGAKKCYDERKLRFSTACPASFYEEYDPNDNMPAQVAIFDADASLAPPPSFVAHSPVHSLSLLFCAKGGGSSNKTAFVQGTKASLTPAAFGRFLTEHIAKLGTSACPPYTIAVVAGGLSPEQNLLTLKLATCGAYDGMTDKPNPHGFRDKALEQTVRDIAKKTGFGAQFGGTQFAVEAIVIRLSRHGASCPLSVGVSCSAHRNLKAVVTDEGFFLEKTCENPASLAGFDQAIAFLDGRGAANDTQTVRVITTDGGMPAVLQSLKGTKPGDRLLLNGDLLVARDAAHARWQALLDDGKPLPAYCTRYPICYAGPARTPDGAAIGSFGPTTAGRMDGYADALMSRGAALVTLAKGNRSPQWTHACARYGAFYLGTPGGIAALIASEHITAQRIIDYEDLGMEAVRVVTVRNLPAFVVTTDTGADFYAQTTNT